VISSNPRAHAMIAVTLAIAQRAIALSLFVRAPPLA